MAEARQAADEAVDKITEAQSDLRRNPTKQLLKTATDTAEAENEI